MSLISRHRRSVAALAAAGSLLAVGAVGAVGVQSADALRHPRAVPAPPTQPTSADQVQNIDQVKTAIKAYYGDTVSGTNPDGSVQHLPSPTGAYAHEVGRIERRALQHLRPGHHARRAIVLDVDDTSLNTYNYEIASNFVYNPVANGLFVDKAAFPAVPGMPDLVRTAQQRGYTVFYLTGRPESQRSGTETNLAKVGFPAVPSSRVFLKDETQPWITCDTRNTRFDLDQSVTPSCSTVERKSETRAHIESLGYDIAANFGDQYSDLKGGYADRRVKLPNPMYYLP